jgi:hypothetical protein
VYSDLGKISPVFKKKGHPSFIHSRSQWMSMATEKAHPGAFLRVPQLKENAF